MGLATPLFQWLLFLLLNFLSQFQETFCDLEEASHPNIQRLGGLGSCAGMIPPSYDLLGTAIVLA